MHVILIQAIFDNQFFYFRVAALNSLKGILSFLYRKKGLTQILHGFISMKVGSDRSVLVYLCLIVHFGWVSFINSWVIYRTRKHLFLWECPGNLFIWGRNRLLFRAYWPLYDFFHLELCAFHDPLFSRLWL